MSSHMAGCSHLRDHVVDHAVTVAEATAGAL
jgi:hypothetical protein